MYKGAQQNKDWIERTGTHATRPRLSANINQKTAGFEYGLLADLKDERARLIERLREIGEKDYRRYKIGLRLSVLNKDIKRLNREASENLERRVMWKVLHEMFPENIIREFSEKCMQLRISMEQADEANP